MSTASLPSSPWVAHPTAQHGPHLCHSADLRSAWTCLTDGSDALFIDCHHLANSVHPATLALTLSKTYSARKGRYIVRTVLALALDANNVQMSTVTYYLFVLYIHMKQSFTCEVWYGVKHTPVLGIVLYLPKKKTVPQDTIFLRCQEPEAITQ